MGHIKTSSTKLKKRAFTYRFFFHYNKPESKAQGCNVLTVHWDKQCHFVNDIKCFAETETHTQKTQPHCIVRGWAHGVDFVKGKGGKVTAIIHP